MGKRASKNLQVSDIWGLKYEIKLTFTYASDVIQNVFSNIISKNLIIKIYVSIILRVVNIRWQNLSLAWKGNVDWGYSIRECRGEYMDLRESK